MSGITDGAEWSSTLQAGCWTPIPDIGAGSTHTFSIAFNTVPMKITSAGGTGNDGVRTAPSALRYTIVTRPALPPRGRVLHFAAHLMPSKATQKRVRWP